MQPIDRKSFFDIYRVAFGPLLQGQVTGIEKLLAALEADPHITDLRWAAYIMATVRHETANTWRPIHEYGTRAYFIKRYGSQTRVGKELGNDTPEEGADYAGRGLAQNTGESNYEMAEQALRKEYPEVVARFEARTGRKFDLTVGDQPNDHRDPDNMLDFEISYCTMSYAMRKGAYTGVGLPKYINGERCDFLNSRRIINSMDCAQRIADAAMKLHLALKKAA